ncbi:hypothetical protein E4T39_07887 [Aureobasidium subglaciale]|nr:hypothetical protein E4T39_07887 [Aureobasidium subglaciale]
MGSAPRKQLACVPEYDPGSVEGKKLAAFKTDITELADKLIHEGEVQQLAEQIIEIQIKCYELRRLSANGESLISFECQVRVSAERLIKEGHIDELKNWYVRHAADADTTKYYWILINEPTSVHHCDMKVAEERPQPKEESVA